jgi:integrase
MPGGALRYLDADLEASLAERATSEPPNRRRALLFPTPTAGVLNLNNFRNRVWLPAIEASGVRTPARIYDLRSTFASNALAAGITVFELARVMGTSVEMIERHYGPLLDGSGASMASRLGAFEAEQARADESARTGR